MDWHWSHECHLKAAEFGEITQTTRQLRRSRSFKVTDFGTNRKPPCDAWQLSFLLVKFWQSTLVFASTAYFDQTSEYIYVYAGLCVR